MIKNDDHKEEVSNINNPEDLKEEVQIDGEVLTSSEADDKKEVVELTKTCEEYLNGWKRAQADYQNLKKETAEKVSALMSYAAENFVLGLLPVLDNFEQAFLGMSNLENNEEKNWRQGILCIKKQLEDFVASFGCERVADMGSSFDPNIFEAVKEENIENKEDDGKIIAVICPAYRMKGKIIRAGKVVVGVYKKMN